MRIIIISKTRFLRLLFPLVINGVFGADTVLKSVSVTEGDSVTLNTDVTEVQGNDQILWTFGPREARIAENYKQNIDMFDSNETFGDRLKMDSQTASLTIRNITTEHSGLYKLQIIRNSGTSYKRYNITVYAPLPIPVISSNSTVNSTVNCYSSVSSCSLLCSVVNVSHVTLSWLKGNSLLSSISVSDLSISLSLPLEVEYQDKNTYSCQINNTITHQTTHLDISGLCHTCAGSDVPKSWLNATIIVAVVLAILAAVMFYLYRKHRSGQKGIYCEPSGQAPETVQTNGEVTYSETAFVPKVQNRKANGTEETIYSTVVRH